LDWFWRVVRVQTNPNSIKIPLPEPGSAIFGPAFYDRNTISLELQWDGTHLTGTVQPGVPGARMYKTFASFPIENASFDPKTRTVRFEATYQPRGRRYIIEGKVSRNTLSGSWHRPEENKDGDFKLIRNGT